MTNNKNTSGEAGTTPTCKSTWVQCINTFLDLTVHIQQFHQHPISPPALTGQLWLWGAGFIYFHIRERGKRNRAGGSCNLGHSKTRLACFPSIIESHSAVSLSSARSAKQIRHRGGTKHAHALSTPNESLTDKQGIFFVFQLKGHPQEHDFTSCQHACFTHRSERRALKDTVLNTRAWSETLTICWKSWEDGMTIHRLVSYNKRNVKDWDQTTTKKR